MMSAATGQCALGEAPEQYGAVELGRGGAIYSCFLLQYDTRVVEKLDLLRNMDGVGCILVSMSLSQVEVRAFGRVRSASTLDTSPSPNAYHLSIPLTAKEIPYPAS